jgi:hypothetical protein
MLFPRVRANLLINGLFASALKIFPVSSATNSHDCDKTVNFVETSSIVIWFIRSDDDTSLTGDVPVVVTTNIPNYYSFNASGWHCINLNSKLAELGGNPPGLVANAQICTIAFYHQSLFNNIGAEEPPLAMVRFWAVLANYKVPFVLNGLDHDYQRWVPLDGSGKPSPKGITVFAGVGAGHGLQKSMTSDSRVAYSNAMNPTSAVLQSMRS